MVNLAGEIIINNRPEFISRLDSLVCQKQNLQIVGMPGGGLSVLSRVVGGRLSSNCYVHYLNCLSSEFFDNLIDLRHMFVDGLNVVLVDEVSAAHFSPAFSPYWHDLLNCRSRINYNLVFIFFTHRPLSLEADPKINLLLKENCLYLQPSSPVELSAFLHEEFPQFKPSAVNKIAKLSLGNFRLAKILAKVYLRQPAVKTNHLLFEPQVKTFLDQLSFTLADYPQDYPLNSSDIGKLFPGYSSKAVNSDIVDGITLPFLLTLKEKKLFYLLHHHTPRVISRNKLLKYIWGSSNYLDTYDHSLDQLIYRLKKKLTKSKSRFSIHTVKGRGFILT